MSRLRVNNDIKALSEFRANASSLMKQVHTTKRPLVITQRGHSAAVLLDAHEYDQLIEKLELLQDIHTGDREIKAGKGVEHEKAKKLILEGLSQ